MALHLDRKKIDELCPRLFRTLDGLGLLPLQLWAKPTEFEKYSRLLFGTIQRYTDVEAGFKEWESRVLREAPYRKEERYPTLEALRTWMLDNADLFRVRANVQHLRTSLYARVFQFLYPRRVLANAYCLKHQGDSRAIEPEFIAEALPESVDAETEKLKTTYTDDWHSIVGDVRESLVANSAYYSKVVSGKEPVAAPEGGVLAEPEAPEEETR